MFFRDEKLMCFQTFLFQETSDWIHPLVASSLPRFGINMPSGSYLFPSRQPRVWASTCLRA